MQTTSAGDTGTDPLTNASHKCTTGHPSYHRPDAYDERLELHKGRHSTVWSARFKPTGDLVVLKSYNKLALKPRQLAGVEREIGLLSQLNSTKQDGVVLLLASFETHDQVYLVFEACMRGDLYQLLVKEKSSLTEHFVAQTVMRPLLAIISSLHSLGIVHRDIKPENIFINTGGQIQLGDFGLAACKHYDRMTERVGTLDYMAPEVLSLPTPDEAAAGRGGTMLVPYNEKVDIWAVGVLCYEMLAGRPPFEVEDPKETAKLILAGRPAGDFPQHLSSACLDFIKSALRRKAGLRPAASDLLQHPWIVSHSSSHNPAAAGDGAGLGNSEMTHMQGPSTPGESVGSQRAKASWPEPADQQPGAGSPQGSGDSGGMGAEEFRDVLLIEHGHSATTSAPQLSMDHVQAGLRAVMLGKLPPTKRRASSGTSEYLGYNTPVGKPSSPDSPSRNGSTTSLTSLVTPCAPMHSSAPQVGACTPASPPVRMSLDEGLGSGCGGGGAAKPRASDGDATSIAWQAGGALLGSGGRRAVGKSRFAR